MTGGEPSNQPREDFTLDPALARPDFSVLDEGDIQSHGRSFALAAVGDLDGDGYEDLASTNARDVGSGRELSYISLRYGRPRGKEVEEAFAFSQAGVKILQDPALMLSVVFESVVAVGDVDGDRLADFLAVVNLSGGGHEADGVYLVYGRADRFGESTPSITQVGVLLRANPAAEQRYWRQRPGALAAGVGDIDGDGLDDFIVTEQRPQPGDSLNPAEDSIAYIFYGRRERLQPGTLAATADARLHAAQTLSISQLGDVNADGLGDVVLGDWELPALPSWLPEAFHWVPGRAQRWSGDVSLDEAAQPFRTARAAGDLDGDGVSDAVVYDEDNIPQLFYGRPGLFENGVDFADAAARFPGLDLDVRWGAAPGAPQEKGQGRAYSLQSLRDLDGDGDDELLFTDFIGDSVFYAQQNALLSGTAARRSGEIELAMAGWNPTLEGTT